MSFSHFSVLNHLVIIYYLHTDGVVLLPSKTDTILIIYSYTVLTLSVALQCFEPISSQFLQILQRCRSPEPRQFDVSSFMENSRKQAQSGLRLQTVYKNWLSGVDTLLRKAGPE